MILYRNLGRACLLSLACWLSDNRVSDANEGNHNQPDKAMMKNYWTDLEKARENLPEDRKKLLLDASAGIRTIAQDRGSVDLIFVCTHNSRRSQLSQWWATLAAERLGLESVHCYSCGTEATACNPRTIACLERAGAAFTKASETANPVYSFTSHSSESRIELFSKAFDHPSLPKKGFVAMMCCDHADKNCPNILGAIERVPLWYVDPKVSDDQPEESSVYDARCKQIATEMLELMTMVAQVRS